VECGVHLWRVAWDDGREHSRLSCMYYLKYHFFDNSFSFVDLNIGSRSTLSWESFWTF